MTLSDSQQRTTSAAPPVVHVVESKPRRRRMTTGSLAKLILLGFVAVGMLIPMYLLVINAFKPQQSILAAPFSLDLENMTSRYLIDAVTAPDYNIIRAYGVTAFFVVTVNLLSILLTAPLAYVIARSRTRPAQLLLIYFIAGTFIPGAALIIPAIYVLKFLGLMGSIGGFILFETTLTIPVSVFLYFAYIKTIPRELDDAAEVDGAGKLRTFWLVIFPLMRPAVATTVILHSMGVWNDFVSPQMILSPDSGIYTVTTGIYAAVSSYVTDYTVVFPTLLLAIAPILIFFLFMQRHIISGLVAGATKG